MVDDFIFRTEQYQRVQKLFGCGIPSEEFRSRYAELYTDANHVCQRIALAAERALFVLDVFHSIDKAELSRTDYEKYKKTQHLVYWLSNLSSLKVYLLFTCLDALTDRIGRVGPRLKKLFADIPDIVLIGLSRYVKVVKIDKEVSEDPRENYIRNESEISVNGLEELRNSLFQFLYSVRRNPYTHEGLTLFPTAKPDDPSIAMHLYIHKKNKLTKEFRKLYFKGFFNEANTILLIAYSEVLNLLGVKISGQLIESFLFSLATRFAVQAFEYELHTNANLLFAWLGFSLGAISSKDICLSSRQLKPLHQEATDRLMRRILTSEDSKKLGYDALLLRNFITVVNSYLKAIEDINTSVHHLNKMSAEAAITRENYENQLRDFIAVVQQRKSFHRLISIPYDHSLWEILQLSDRPCATRSYPM